MAEKVLSSAAKRPKFSTCCQRGHVSLHHLPPPPPFLNQILDSDDADGKEFRSNICQYNMALAFTSLSVSEDTAVNRRGGWVFHL
jgi:hypothetical protein